jgi:pectate lyase
MVNGATNVIIQNVAITDINPEYVWGGDAITLDGTDNVWIDHVTVSFHSRWVWKMTDPWLDFEYRKTAYCLGH